VLVAAAALALANGCGNDPGSETIATAATPEDVAACLIPIYREHEVPPGTTGIAAAAGCLGLDPTVLESNPIFTACVVSATVRDPESEIIPRLGRCEELRQRMEAGGAPAAP
jgi:hypothetical protein